MNDEAGGTAGPSNAGEPLGPMPGEGQTMGAEPMMAADDGRSGSSAAGTMPGEASNSSRGRHGNDRLDAASNVITAMPGFDSTGTGMRSDAMNSAEASPVSMPTYMPEEAKTSSTDGGRTAEITGTFRLILSLV